jgi:xylose isomerase
LPTVGHALAFITTLDKPELFGLNPEFGHEQMTGLNFVAAIQQALRTQARSNALLGWRWVVHDDDHHHRL